MSGTILHSDGKCRCGWPGHDALYVHYHDTEWGVPEYDSRALFEKLILDGFQAGLSWITILRKRDNFRRAFDDFQPDVIARYDEAKIEALMQDAGIVRNQAKIRGTIRSAKAWLDIQSTDSAFSDLLWGFVDGKPFQGERRSREQVPTQNEASVKMSKALKNRGFNFCGPTITYAFMQATGLVNDHMVDCFRYEECKALAR